jgi:hypothetical protein
MFGFYGDAFDADNEYEDNLRGNSDHPDDWVIYGESLDGGCTDTYYTDAQTESSYTAKIDYQYTEIVLWCAIKKWYTSYKRDYYEIPISVTGTYYWSEDFDFPYFGGSIRVSYKVVAA